jgi:uncharacterized protein YndB with AHSA1/START domain
MKRNEITILIHKPIAEVFEFVINPANTPQWIEHISLEETNEFPPNIGTVYRNKDMRGVWTDYTVTAIETNKIFELTEDDNNYHVRYTCKKLRDNLTEMKYNEWVDKGIINNPFDQDVFEKLKLAIEN